MNNVTLIGRLTKDPDLRFIPGSGMALATKEQINCTEGGIYITDAENIVDLYKGMSIYESEEI